MYGFFRPGSSNLTSDEQQLFRSYYCRICYCLRLLGGQSARFLTTYDVAIYSIIISLASNADPPPPVKCQRISTKIMKQYLDDETGKRLAKASLVVFGEKIRDDYIDGNKYKAAGMDLLFNKLISTACNDEPEIHNIAYEGTEKINSMQDSGCNIYDILTTYGNMVADLFSVIYPLDDSYRKLVKATAIWTFYIDMLSDYSEDYKAGKYNGFKIDNCKTIQECFDVNYRFFLELNRRINQEIIMALDNVKDDSLEWSVLNKILNCAIGTVAFYILCGKDVGFKFIKGCKSVTYRLKYGNTKSNFR